MTVRPIAIVRAALQAYIDKDRPAIEALVAQDYRFTSPLDNAIDRQTYFKLCWPNSEAMLDFEIVHAAEDESRAYVVYEAQIAGKRIRNCEVHEVRDGQLVATEVYFGWDLPHKASAGQHLDQDG